MKKGVVIIIGIVFITIILFLIIYVYKIKGFEKFDERTSLCIGGCDNEACITACKDMYYFAKAEGDGSLKWCSKINNENSKQGCEDLLYYTSSIKDKKISSCDNINEINLKERCKRKIVYDEGIEGKNPDSCNKLNDWPECKDIIRINIAYYNSDLSFCEQIENSEMKSICLESVNLKKEEEAKLIQPLVSEQTNPNTNPPEISSTPYSGAPDSVEVADPINVYLNMY
jgi:hypothetical protein